MPAATHYFRCIWCLLPTRTPYTVAFVHNFGVGPEMKRLKSGNTQQHFCTPLHEAFFNTSVGIRKCRRLCDRWYVYERFYVSKLGIKTEEELDLLAVKHLRAESADSKQIRGREEDLLSRINKFRLTATHTAASASNIQESKPISSSGELSQIQRQQGN
jgi:hypothetical protein